MEFENNFFIICSCQIQSLKQRLRKHLCFLYLLCICHFSGSADGLNPCRIIARLKGWIEAPVELSCQLWNLQFPEVQTPPSQSTLEVQSGWPSAPLILTLWVLSHSSCVSMGLLILVPSNAALAFGYFCTDNAEIFLTSLEVLLVFLNSFCDLLIL